MTYDEILKLDNDPPVLLLDGNMGVLIRRYDTTVGVQVFGEENIREIRHECITDMGNGALAEILKNPINVTWVGDMFERYIEGG